MTLAVQGGTPVREQPFPAWPAFDEGDCATVADVLRSGRVNYWTGEHGKRFEESFARYCGAEHGIAVANGTVALEAALIALNIGVGDEVIVPSRTFVATASSVMLRGAKPVFADINPTCHTLSASEIERLRTPYTRAVIAVHMAGVPCEMAEIAAVCRQYGIALIEDCAQAHGAEHNGEKIGTLGDIATFSFCHDKLLTTGGEGGMVVTQDSALARRVWEFKDHGKNLAEVKAPPSNPGFRWLHDSCGTNLRMTEMQAALGVRLLEKLPVWIEHRRNCAHRIEQGLQHCEGLQPIVLPSHRKNVFYRSVFTVDLDRLRSGWSRDEFMVAVIAEGIPCSVGGCGEIYLERVFQNAGLSPAARLPNAKKVSERVIAFLVHPGVNGQVINDTVAAVEKVYREACR